jgi:hypothetical protein
MNLSLRNLSYEHDNQVYAIAKSLGKIIGISTSIETTKNPRFCANFKVGKGWITNIALKFKECILLAHNVLIDYDNVPFRCRACQSWKHSISIGWKIAMRFHDNRLKDI